MQILLFLFKKISILATFVPRDESLQRIKGRFLPLFEINKGKLRENPDPTGCLQKISFQCL